MGPITHGRNGQINIEYVLGHSMQNEFKNKGKKMAAPAILTLTDAAVERVEFLLNKAKEPVLGLRVSITKTGCSGSSYKMDYVTEANVKAGDDVITEKGVSVYIDPKATMYLLGTVLDYRKGNLCEQFVFDNPNVDAACGCGESFTFKTQNSTGKETADKSSGVQHYQP